MFKSKDDAFERAVADAEFKHKAASDEHARRAAAAAKARAALEAADADDERAWEKADAEARRTAQLEAKAKKALDDASAGVEKAKRTRLEARLADARERGSLARALEQLRPTFDRCVALRRELSTHAAKLVEVALERGAARSEAAQIARELGTPSGLDRDGDVWALVEALDAEVNRAVGRDPLPVGSVWPPRLVTAASA